MTAGTVTYGSATGRGVILAAVLGSGMVMLDGTVVNVALRTIGTDLDASLSQLQWISNAYLLALASLILLGGALGDRLGRRRIFVTGVVAFAAASAVCGLAPDPGTLIAARALQGVGGALLTPGSLAIIEAVFAHEDRGRAIGAWTGLGSIAAAIGPFVGGALVQYADWRWIFWVNVPLAAVTVIATLRFVPETSAPTRGPVRRARCCARGGLARLADLLADRVAQRSRGAGAGGRSGRRDGVPGRRAPDRAPDAAARPVLRRGSSPRPTR